MSNPSEWNSGYTAFVEDIPFTDNPFDKDDQSYTLWNDGWLAAEADRDDEDDETDEDDEENNDDDEEDDEEDLDDEDDSEDDDDDEE